MTTRHLTTAEAAKRLRTSARMIRWYVSTDRLVPTQRIGTAMLFDPADLDQLEPSIVRRNWKVAS
jgi:DNA-binding transcriptional MerR regulator